MAQRIALGLDYTWRNTLLSALIGENLRLIFLYSLGAKIFVEVVLLNILSVRI